MNRYCLIVNPAAGRARPGTIPLLRSELDRAGLPHDLRTSEAPGFPVTLALEAAAAGYEAVLAFGGDGTVGQVASGLIGTQVRLGILPGGTMNLLAQELGIPARIPEAVRVIADGGLRRIEAGQVAGRSFLLCAGAGLDAAVVRDVERRRKRRHGRLAYYLQAPATAARYRFPLIQIVTGDGMTFLAGQVVIANARHYGERFVIAPGASLDDGVMDACIFHGRRARDYVRYWLALRGGRHFVLDDVECLKGRAFLLRPAADAARIPFQVDGDYLCDLPVEVHVRPEALAVFAPPAPPPPAARRTTGSG